MSKKHNESTEVQIRRFLLSDLYDIMQIEDASYAVDAFSEDIFKGLFRECSDLFLVAEKDDRVIGYMVSCVLPRKAHVISIAVMNSGRRLGVGRRLVEFTFQQLDSRDVRIVELEVRKSNTVGISFWHELGFTTIDTVPGYYHDGEDALRMRRVSK